MLSKKLLNLLNSFSKSQFTRFEKFLKSPYFNENEQIIQLYFLLKAKRDISKTAIWVQLFGTKSYKDIQLRRLSSEMTRLAESFLVQEEMEKRTSVENILLLESLKTKTLELHFLQTYNKIKEGTTKKLQSPEYFFEVFSIEMINHEFRDLTAPQNNKLENLHSANHFLDNHYLLIKLKFYFAFLNYKNAQPIQAEFSLPVDFLSFVEKSDSFKEPLIFLYYNVILLLLEKGGITQFRLLIDLLIKHEHEITVKELRNIYYCLQNYCALQINRGNTSFILETFNIYKTMIERDILPGDEDLKLGVYKNILTLGLIVKEFIWTENFIQVYTEKLPKEHRENAKNYNLAKVYFHKQEYEKVIEQLREVEYKELVYALGGKLMLLKTYFELKEQRPMDSLIDSFRIYLRRNKLISKNVRQQYLNVLRFTKKLANIAPYDKKGVQKVKEQIEACKALADKKWLIDKVVELEK